jgi:transcriptional regulator with XRE-family HTH domain
VDGASAEPSYSAWILEEMRRREWRQADFARAAGVDVSMVSRWLQGRGPQHRGMEGGAAALGADLDALLTLAGHRPRSPRDDDPRVATLVAKVRQVMWTPERFLIVDALLDDLRQRSSRVPIEQVALPGLGEGESPAAQGAPSAAPPQGESLRSGGEGRSTT